MAVSPSGLTSMTLFPMYEHFRDGSGTPMTFDYEEGYKEDPAIRREIHREMNQTLVAANELVKEGSTSVDFHSGVRKSKTMAIIRRQKTGRRLLVTTTITVIQNSVSMEILLL